MPHSKLGEKMFLRKAWHASQDMSRQLQLRCGLKKLNTEELVAQQTKDFIVEYQKLHAALSYSRKAIQDGRNEQLRALLAYAKSHSPWYKKALASIDLNTFTEEKLNEIPILTKTELMKNWDSIVTDRKLTLARAENHIKKMGKDGDTLHFLERYHVLATSGSSGTRGVYVYNWEEWNKFTAYATRHAYFNHDRSAPILDPTKKMTVAMVVISNAVYGMYSVAKSYHFDRVEKYYFPMTLPLEEIIKGLNHVQADILQGIPSTIYKLCQEARAGRLIIQPKIISVGAEPLYKPMRELIKQTWPQASLFNRYGSSEGLFGRYCHADSDVMHLNDDGCIVEPVDEYGNAVEKGIRSHKIYLTNLYNYTLPLIRYELNDQLLFLDKTCACGMEHQLIAEPEGRPEFDFIYHDTIFVHHLLFVTPLLHERNIQEYQVQQTKNGADIKIVTIGFVDTAKLRNKLCEQLSIVGLIEPEITITKVTKIDYPPSGKLRRFLKMETS